MSKKIKVLTLGDHPLSPSGVGTQTKYVIEALLETERFEVVSLGGAIRHHNYDPILVEGHGQNWKIFPVDGYGSQEMLRSIIRNERPDIVWIMTDPRFWGWLWEMENEIRSLCPLVYYHVWDNYPAPMFNKRFYESNDYIASISKLTQDIVRTVTPDIECVYIPHAVDNKMFAPLTKEQIEMLRAENLPEDKDKFIVFWNSRNARRKQSGSLIFWWKEWLDERNLHDKATLIMHTDPKDVHGQDLEHIVEHLGLTNRQVLFSMNKIDTSGLAALYNMADVVISVSDAEGFGLSMQEAISCGIPIIATATGGMQDQLFTDSGEPCGIPLFPAAKSIIGSQEVPYIYEDRLSNSQVKSALSNMYDMGPEERRKLGNLGRNHAMTNFSMKRFKEQWVEFMLKVYEEQGSWSTRKNHNGIIFKEIA